MSSCGIENGSCITVILENPGPILLRSEVKDRTPTDDKRPAARSPPLAFQAASVEISVKTFKDQEKFEEKNGVIEAVNYFRASLSVEESMIRLKTF